MIYLNKFEDIRECQLDQKFILPYPKNGWYHQMWTERLYYGYINPLTNIVIKSPIRHNRVKLFAILAKIELFDHILILYMIEWL